MKPKDKRRKQRKKAIIEMKILKNMEEEAKIDFKISKIQLKRIQNHEKIMKIINSRRNFEEFIV